MRNHETNDWQTEARAIFHFCHRSMCTEHSALGTQHLAFLSKRNETNECGYGRHSACVRSAVCRHRHRCDKRCVWYSRFVMCHVICLCLKQASSRTHTQTLVVVVFSRAEQLIKFGVGFSLSPLPLALELAIFFFVGISPLCGVKYVRTKSKKNTRTQYSTAVRIRIGACTRLTGT